MSVSTRQLHRKNLRHYESSDDFKDAPQVSFHHEVAAAGAGDRGLTHDRRESLTSPTKSYAVMEALSDEKSKLARFLFVGKEDDNDMTSMRDSDMLSSALALEPMHIRNAVCYDSITVTTNLLEEYSAELCSAVTYNHQFSNYRLCTPLHIAILMGNVPMVKVLLECKNESVFAVRHTALCSKDSAWHAAIRYLSYNPTNNPMLMLDLILKISRQREELAGLDLINVVGNGGSQTLLQYAIAKKQYDAIEGLLLRGSIFKQRWIRSLQREERMKVVKIVEKCVITQKEWMRIDQNSFTCLPRDVVEVIWTFLFGRYYSAHQRIRQLEKMFPDIHLTNNKKYASYEK